MSIKIEHLWIFRWIFIVQLITIRINWYSIRIQFVLNLYLNQQKGASRQNSWQHGVHQNTVSGIFLLAMFIIESIRINENIATANDE